MSGNLFVISAPSGAGKTSLIKSLLALEPELQLSVSYTTRPPRPNERDGVDYHFVSDERFFALQAQGEFLESAHVHGNYYATSHSWLKQQLAADRDVTLEIDWQGAEQVRRLLPKAIGIFILPPSFAVLSDRLRQRGQDTSEVIAHRLKAAREEMQHYSEFDYVIINDDFERAVLDLRSLVRACRLQMDQQIERHLNVLNDLLKER